MGIFLEIIEWLDQYGGAELLHREPPQGSADIKMGAQLIVREGQVAIFMSDGRIADMFGPGKYTLTTENIPILTQLLSLPFGFKSPFRSEVLFISTNLVPDFKFGTPEPIVFRDKELGMVRVKAFGTYTVKVDDPRKFVTEIVGTKGFMTKNRVEEFLRPVVVSRFTDALADVMTTVFDLPKVYNELGDTVVKTINSELIKFGLISSDVYIQSIGLPEDIEKAIDERSGMGAIADMNKYFMYKAAQGIGKGDAGVAGTAAQMGAGVMMGAQMMDSLKDSGKSKKDDDADEETAKCPSCGHRNPTKAKFCSNCGGSLKKTDCPSCHKDVEPGAKFCPNCGAKL
jgi:membrane protease subunit (stomatin/prohibitin family)